MNREEAVRYLENMKKDDEEKFNNFIDQCRWYGTSKAPKADHMIVLVGWHCHEYGVLE